MATAGQDYLRNCFRGFAGICANASPLYAALSPQIADDPQTLALAEQAQAGQAPVNMLFGAVHYLLLGGREHALAGFYRSLGGRDDPAGAWPVFKDFCGTFRGEIVELVATRRVQTNEVGRSALLIHAFAMAQRLFGRPLHLIEVGASAGLNLLFDRYRYEYSDGQVCGPESPVVIRTELRGSSAPLIEPDPPAVAGRVGIDVSPVDVTDPGAMRWVEALIWPDQIERVQRHRRAVELASADPPQLIAGDGLDLVPGLVADVAGAHLPCVYHSHTTYQMGREGRQAFDLVMSEAGGRHDLAYVSLEWLGDDPGPRLHLTSWSRGRSRTRYLAECDHHGAWLRWVDSEARRIGSFEPAASK